MKLSIVSRFITFSIVGLLVVSALTAVWGWRQLDKPYQIADEFQQYRNTFDIEVRILLERYLASGQADLLQAAEDKLTALSAQSFPGSVKLKTRLSRQRSASFMPRS